MAKRKTVFRMMRLALVIFILCWSSATSFAQQTQRRVHAGAIVGSTISHVVYGDFFYNAGGHAGLYSDVRLHKRWAIRPELLYVLNPGYIRPTQFPDWPDQRTRFGYVEVPVMLRFIPRHKKKKTEISITGGGSYARLMHYRVRTESGLDLSDAVVMDQRNAFVPHLGCCILTKYLGVEVRFSHPVDFQLGPVVSTRLLFQI